MDAVADGRVIEEEEDVDRIGVGIDENSLAVDLERTRKSLAGVGNDAVGDFEAIDIGLGLLITAESMAEAVRRKTEEREKKEKRGKRSPIIEGADTPGGAGVSE